MQAFFFKIHCKTSSFSLQFIKIADILQSSSLPSQSHVAMDNDDLPLNPAILTTADSGLIISKTETIQSFLSTSTDNPHLSSDLRHIASSLSLQASSVSYKPLRSIWVACDPSTRPALSTLLSGSRFILNSPQPRQKRAELKERLKKLEEVAERKAYKELVKDITRKEETEPFSSYKDQLGFGELSVNKDPSLDAHLCWMK